MANNAGQAQNQLGQLFVDIGVGGVGQTLKALNSVSASFLLTKNAATQAIRPFIDMGKQAANSAVGIGKMAAALGTTTINAQKLQYYLKTYKAEGLEGDVASLQQMFTRIQSGLGGIDGQRAVSLGMLGLDWQKYGGSFEDTLKFIQDVKDALQSSGMTENEKVMHLQNLGLSNWKYLFEKSDFDINKSLNISDETIAKLQEASEETNKITNELDKLWKNFTGDFAKKVGIPALKDINANFSDNRPLTNSPSKARTLTRFGAMGMGAGGGALAGSLLGPLGVAVGGLLGGYGGLKGNEKLLNMLEPVNDSALNGTLESAALPSLPNVDNRTTINLTNKISGNNVQFEELTATEENSLTGGRQIDINAFTTHNGHEL